jgi:hypothetical protein
MAGQAAGSVAGAASADLAKMVGNSPTNLEQVGQEARDPLELDDYCKETLSIRPTPDHTLGRPIEERNDRPDHGSVVPD